MKTKDDFIEEHQSELQSVDQTINSLAKKAKKSETHVKVDMFDKVEHIKTKKRIVERRLNDLKGVPEESWQELKVGVERASQELHEMLSDTTARFL